MATKTKKTIATTKKAATSKTKKSDTLKQIENLEKALGNAKPEDIINLVPEEIKADIEADKAAADMLEETKNIDFDIEVKKIIETAEPSEEIKEQVKDFEEGKEEFNKKLDKEPENVEQIIKEELKRVEEIKKKAEALKANIQRNNKSRFDNETFTNWWNGSSGLY